MFRKSISVLLSVLLMFTLFTVSPINVDAVESDSSGVGADLISENVGSYADERWQWTDAGVQQERCTYRAWHEAYDRLGISLPLTWGNGGTWAANARSDGYSVDNTPSANSIVCWSGGGWGHVAYVTGVDDNDIYIREGGINPSNSYPNYWFRDTSFSRSNQNRWGGYSLEGYIHLSGNPDPPSNPWISASTNRIPTGGSITFNFGADNATNYWIGIDRDGNRIITEHVTSGVNYSFNEAGNYSAYITAYNYVGGVDSDRVYFSVAPQGHVMSDSEGAGRTIPDGDYWICSRIAQDFFIDIPYNDFNTQDGTNLQTWRWGSGLPPIYDVYHFEYLNNGFYLITQMNTKKAIDVADASLFRGTNVQMYGVNKSNAQQWSIEKTDHGYKLRSRCNSYYMDISNGYYDCGTNVLVWENNDGDNQLFSFIPYAPDEKPLSDGVYVIQSSLSENCFLDVDGYPNSFANKSNIQIYDKPDDQFRIEYAGNGYYRIYENTSNLLVEIINNGNSFMNNYENAMLYGKTDSKGQLWKIKKNADGTYFFINQMAGYYLDLFASSTENGTNIDQYQYNGTKAQKWIPRRVIKEDMVTVGNVATNSDATSVNPSVTVKVDNKTITKNTDYTVAVKSDIENGTGTVTVTGKGNYSGTVTKSFKITINDTTVINDFLSQKFYTEKDDIITYYLKLSLPFSVNHLNGTIYYNQEVLEPIITPYARYHAPCFDDVSFQRIEQGQIRFDLYANDPITLDNDIVIRMQFRVIKKGGESWLGNDFTDAQFAWDNLIQYGMEPHILTNQKLFVIGDTDGDSKVNIRDVTAIQRHLAELDLLSEEQLAAADTNGDGKIDITDATYLQMYLAEYDVVLGKQS